ncbi:hypothetical protein BASA60_006853 [Batrachochytrium salamandrivorans]|nr:hypothetical protein BASA60_006853 [Batrachochytrium salamandrivorans]
MLILAGSSRLLISPTRASYKAIPVPRRDPTEGFSMVVDPEFKGSSPKGWTMAKLLGVIMSSPQTLVVKPHLQPVMVYLIPSSIARTKPRTDANVAPLHSGLDSGIAIHEYGHGVSNRLTGGSATGGCLSTAEARGMGEGWSDMMAMFVLAKKSDTATTSIPMGTYVETSQEVSRSHPYTTDMKVNPLTYGDLKTLREVHAPCNPTFLSARDAIVAADASYYKGANKCEILKAFAKRGLGSKATDTRKNDFSVPSECDGGAPSPRATTTDIKTQTTTTTTDRKTKTTKKVGTTTKKAGTTTDRKTKTTKKVRTTPIQYRAY